MKQQKLRQNESDKFSHNVKKIIISELQTWHKSHCRDFEV